MLPPHTDGASFLLLSWMSSRLIAQLHEQAIATANDLSARHNAIRADVAKDARRGKAEACFFRRRLPLSAWQHRRRELRPRGLAVMAAMTIRPLPAFAPTESRGVPHAGARR
jgi:hypothetical protein